MLTKIQKWGNSFAIRIPKTFTSEINLEKNSVIELSLIDKQILIKPIDIEKYSLKQLLSGVTDKNIHSETDTGEVCGNEIL